MNSNINKEKYLEVQEIIKASWKLGRIRIDSTVHARKRAKERDINIFDLREVIFYGYREEEVDRWEEKRKHWTYALRNKNVDGRDIRVIFDIESYPEVIVVTLMIVYSK